MIPKAGHFSSSSNAKDLAAARKVNVSNAQPVKTRSLKPKVLSIENRTVATTVSRNTMPPRSPIRRGSSGTSIGSLSPSKVSAAEEELAMKKLFLKELKEKGANVIPGIDSIVYINDVNAESFTFTEQSYVESGRADAGPPREDFGT